MKNPQKKSEVAATMPPPPPPSTTISGYATGGGNGREINASKMFGSKDAGEEINEVGGGISAVALTPKSKAESKDRQ